MSTSYNAKIQIETGQDHNDPAAMTDSGDHINFTISGGTVWSGKSGYAPTIEPNGVATGRSLVATHASNDTLTIAACTCYLAGVLTSVSADATLTITRPADAYAKICSVTINSSGSYVMVVGADAADTTFISTRGGNGGPPYIPATSIEVAQIKVISDTAAVIAASEIKQNSNTYTERYDYPTWTYNSVGVGTNATTSAQTNAHVKFDTTLDVRHTGDVAKGIYIEYYEPEFSTLAKTLDFTPAENSTSVSSTQIYGNQTVGSSSMSIGTGGFTALLSDGVTDGLVSEKDQILTVKYYPDQDAAPYLLTQGTVSLKRTFPVANQNQATVTIAAEKISAEFSS